jgi:hypothetical protein
MKSPQIKIIVLKSGIAISSPYNPKNNEVFKELHGHFDSANRRWILPNTAECKAKIAEMFGKESPNVVAKVTDQELSISDNQLVLGGHVVARLHERYNTIRMSEGVEIVTGAWDVVASMEQKHPRLTVGTTLKIVVRKDFAATHGLEIEEELDDIEEESDEVEAPDPLRPFADSDLTEELERRGYRVEKPVESMF